jgi:hypothetical protein
MSCVPYDQYAFTYGPRDYLNQLMSLISSLRGGQQRYLPLLISKINECMPSMPLPGYTIPAVPGNTRIEEIYEGHSSATTSNDTTPFGSPPLDAIPNPQGFVIPEMSTSPTGAGFPAVMTTGGQYGDMTAQAPIQGFQDFSLQGYQRAAGNSKYEQASGG